MRDKDELSPSSSCNIIKFDLNEVPPSDTNEFDLNEVPPSDTNEEDHRVSSGASRLRNNNIDLNKSPREEPPNHDDVNITQNLLNPKPLKRKGRGSGRLNEAKKQRLNAALEVEDVWLIFEKTLSMSDVNPNQSRFLIPLNKLKRNDFLTQEESSFLEQEKRGKQPGLEAILVDQRSEAWSLVFKRWVMKKKKNNSQSRSLNYVLNCGWNDIVKENNLKAKDKISLWSFRCDGVLCFSLVTHPPTIIT
ncbi:unnamed protein product [Eruca vesicaria subsp. sativa]|uniref:TF-B3 domain-containing protein n=1 Tax=Eruca vesicaria subsp. sativa TaxID=29727 RepID=A0ABC8J852_ERUVS|nr:unnamed protein product [Eruca vesicaria subsp. sativa]